MWYLSYQLVQDFFHQQFEESSNVENKGMKQTEMDDSLRDSEDDQQNPRVIFISAVSHRIHAWYIYLPYGTYTIHGSYWFD